MKSKVAVVGAGLAGLSCAVRLHESGVPVEIFEASDGVGGRVRTDKVDGFLLDRGFQVYLDAYRQAGEFLDPDALDLQAFEPGAKVWKNEKIHCVMDVFRRPGSVFSSALAPIGTIGDKGRVALLRNQLLGKSIEEIWRSPNVTTLEYLRNRGFSDQMIDEFFRGFYGGIFLENELSTSSRMFEFTYKMFSEGYATLPANGMQAIPDQIVARMPSESIHLNSSVKAIDGNRLSLETETLEFSDIVIAADGKAAAQLLPGVGEPVWQSTACLYFSTENPPVTEPLIILKGDRTGLINNLCVPSAVSRHYAPIGKSLVSVSVLGDRRSDENLESKVRAELADWFGAEVENWKSIKTTHVRKALPIDPPGNHAGPLMIGSILVCGDHTTTGSIEGAIQSGLQAADQILSKNS